MPRQRFLITGATSGLGRAVALRLAQQKVEALILPVRNAERGAQLAQELMQAGCRQVETPLVDLASLSQVRSFTDYALKSHAHELDGVLFNAGIQSARQLHFTADGFESTFAVNHLAHHLLYRRLVPLLADSARVAWVSSGTHDPSDPAARMTGFRGARYTTFANVSQGQFPGSKNEPEQCRYAYATSKLCNLMSARAFAQARSAMGDIVHFSFDPGLMPGTGLARAHGAMARWTWQRLMPHLGNYGLIPGSSTTVGSAAVLAELLSGHEFRVANGAYVDFTGLQKDPYLPFIEKVVTDDLIGRSDAAIEDAGAPVEGTGHPAGPPRASELVVYR